MDECEALHLGSSLMGTEARRRAVTHRAVVRNAKLVAVDLEVTDVFPRSEHKARPLTLVPDLLSALNLSRSLCTYDSMQVITMQLATQVISL